MLFGLVCEGWLWWERPTNVIGATLTTGCWNTLCRREREHLQCTAQSTVFVTPAVTGLAHLPGKRHPCAWSLPWEPEGWMSVSLLLCPLALFFLQLECNSSCSDRSWHLPAAFYSVAWCSADIPQKVPGKQSNTDILYLITEIQLKISSWVNPLM